LECPKCSGRIAKKDRFCRHCGAIFGQNPPKKPITIGPYDNLLRWGQNWLRGPNSSKLIGACVLILIVAGITETASSIRGISSSAPVYMVAVAGLALVLSVFVSIAELEHKTSARQAKEQTGNIRETKRHTKRQTRSGRSDDLCFIATAAYGTPLAREVNTLRIFRDRSLNKNVFGKRLIAIYSKISPPLAKVISSSKSFRRIVRILLNPLVMTFKRLGYEQ